MSILEQITAEAVPSDEPAPWPDFTGTAWRVTVTYKGESLVTPFFQGEAYVGEPDKAHVLSSLCQDVRYADDPDELYLDDLEHDEAHELIEGIKAQTAELRRVFGDDLEALIEEVEDA
jgi:hypothetical protein